LALGIGVSAHVVFRSQELEVRMRAAVLGILTPDSWLLTPRY
jgi:hypothetical protein